MWTYLLTVLADDKAPAPSSGFDPLSIMLPVLLIGVLFYMLILRPRNQGQNTLAQMNKGDKIITISGIYGTIVSVSDKPELDEIVVKVDDNVRLKMTKNAIHRNLTNEEKAKEAAVAAKAAKAAAKAAKAAGKNGAAPTPPAAPPSTSVTTKEGK
jgi:preprotein translocase subunit YajC